MISRPNITLGVKAKRAWLLSPSIRPFWVMGLSGLVMGISPAPVDAWWLAWLALVPLWGVVLQPQAGVRRAIVLGLIWGISYHGWAISWITGLHPLTWMGLSWWTSVAIALGAWGFITLFGAAIAAIWTGVMVRFTAKQPTWQQLLLGTTLWCSLEWLWSRSPLWWTSLSYTQSPSNLVILHLGQLSGPLTVVAALVGVNGLFAAALWQPCRRWRYVSVAIGLILGLHLLGLSLYLQPLVQPADTALRIGLIQGNVPTRIKLFENGIKKALAGYGQGYQKLVDEGVDAVLLPEGAFPYLWPQASPRNRSLRQAVRDRQVMAWIGTFMPQGERITQSLITLMPDGSINSRYNKVKLVPLGEYIPLEQTLGQLIGRLTPIRATMVPGAEGQTFETPLGRATVGICFDSVFAHLFRIQTAQGGQFILTASNNDPYSARMMAQHHAHDVMRAIETDRWAVRATNTGYSGVVDPHGRTQWRSGFRTYEVHAATIYRRQTQTLYVQWGNWLLVVLLSLSGASWVISSTTLISVKPR